MFRAFLGLTAAECEEMAIEDYMNYQIMLDHVLEMHQKPIIQVPVL
jgi:hypothetical protein